MNKAFEKILERLEGWKEQSNHDEDDYYLGRYTAFNQAIEIVQEVAEEYNDGWIPSKDRLPEENESVLIYAESRARGGSIMVVACLNNGFWFAQTSSNTFGLTGIGQFNVIAWQPLPQPYKESGNNDNSNSF